MLSQFSTLSKTGKRIFKKPQLIFHHQDPECTFINDTISKDITVEVKAELAKMK